MIGLLLALACGAKRAGPAPLWPEPLAVSREGGALVVKNESGRPVALEGVAVSPAGALPDFQPTLLAPGEALRWPIVPPDASLVQGTLTWRAPPGPAERRTFRLPSPASPPPPPPAEPAP